MVSSAVSVLSVVATVVASAAFGALAPEATTFVLPNVTNTAAIAIAPAAVTAFFARGEFESNSLSLFINPYSPS